MSLGLHDDRRRRRQRARLAVLRWLLAGGVVIAVGVYAYQIGARLAQRDLSSRDQQIGALSARIAQLESQLQAHQSELATERISAEEWRNRYQRDLGTAEARELFQLLQAKIEAGADPRRLRWVLEQIAPGADCDPRPQVRRVAVRTPLSRGTSSPAMFADGALGVILDGSSARDAAGKPEGWFDPTHPVKLRLVMRGGKTMESEGALPRQQSFVDGDREYRLSIAIASRGFANVSLQRCRFP